MTNYGQGGLSYEMHQHRPQQRPRLESRPPSYESRLSSAPPTPPPRGIMRSPSMSPPLQRQRLHRYPSVSFDLTPSPSSKGSSMMIDL